MAVRLGGTPSSKARLLARSREALAPHASLEAVSEASGRIVSGVSITAALTSALSLAGAVGVAKVGWGYALPAVVFSATTVALAIWASIPRKDVLRPGDLEDVDRFFTDQLAFRGRLLRLSGLTLCAALASIPIPFIAGSLESEGPGFAVTANVEGGRLKVAAEAEDAGSDASIVLSLAMPRGERVIGRADGASEGTVAVRASVPNRIAGRSATINAELLDGEKVLDRRSIPLPGFAPPARQAQAVGGEDRNR